MERSPAPSGSRAGLWLGLGAYSMWGIFPLYFHLLRAAGAAEIVVHRVLWSLLLCLVLTTVLRQWRAAAELARSRRTVLGLTAAAVVLAANWGIYVYAVNSGHVIEASLGYFVNPLVTVLLAVLVLGERLRAAQWTALAVGTVAVAVLTADYGRVPWIALGLAVSFGCYGLLKNRAGRSAGALAGLSVETAALAPAALAGVVWLAATGRGHLDPGHPGLALLLASTGLATLLPLLCFAGAARRVPLSTLGLLQYLTPTLQFALGVAVFRERMPATRWIGFGLVWVALGVLSTDGWLRARDARGARRAQPGSAPSTSAIRNVTGS